MLSPRGWLFQELYNRKGETLRKVHTEQNIHWYHCIHFMVSCILSLQDIEYNFSLMLKKTPNQEERGRLPFFFLMLPCAALGCIVEIQPERRGAGREGGESQQVKSNSHWEYCQPQAVSQSGVGNPHNCIHQPYSFCANLLSPTTLYLTKPCSCFLLSRL